MSSDLFSPVVLRSGGRLRNRIAKAAMEENMAGRAQLPDERLISLYRRWGAGGAGLLITGNGMVHARGLSRPGRQVRAEMPGVAWAPSAVAVQLGKHSKRFAQPVAMNAEQIRSTIDRF